jgi:hypothetical protein
MAYATVDDLAGYVTTVPSNAPILLERASRTVDQALIAASYDTDDTDVQAALRAATCEHVAYLLESGDDTGTGAAREVTSVSIGSVSLSRGRGGSSSSGSAGTGGLAPQAWMVLQQAELTGQEPWS